MVVRGYLVESGFNMRCFTEEKVICRGLFLQNTAVCTLILSLFEAADWAWGARVSDTYCLGGKTAVKLI